MGEKDVYGSNSGGVDMTKFLRNCLAAEWPSRGGISKNKVIAVGVLLEQGDCGNVSVGTAFLDISGFTKLASKLRVEELKYHINQIKKYNGDVVKFCGDCLIVIWPSHPLIDDQKKCSHIIYAVRCVMELLEHCGHYEDTLGDNTVTLNLHCALSAGDLHCMCLGNESRMEFLIAGEQFHELSEAEARAGTGQLCLAPPAHQLVRQWVTGRAVSESGIFLIEGLTRYAAAGETFGRDMSSKRRSSLLGGCPGNSFTANADETPSKRRRRQDSDSSTENLSPSIAGLFSPLTSSLLKLKTSSQRRLVVDAHSPSRASQSSLSPAPPHAVPSPDFHPSAISCCDHGNYFAERSGDNKQMRSFLTNVNPSHPEEYERLLERFVHESARMPILHRTTEHLSELRVVVTMFVHLTNLDTEFNLGLLDRPQRAMLIVLDTMHTLGGMLRQFVVDDKGCVLICCFGVPGYSSQQDEVRAVYSALCMRTSLLEEDIHCRIGIAKGLAYCGYVGCADRKEYCVMGSSVNIAARLMSKAAVGQILVNGGVYLRVNGEFTFEQLSKIQAKGYSSAVPVYSAKSLRRIPAVSVTLQLAVTRIYSTRMCSSFIGRDKELNLLQESFSRLHEGAVDMEQVESFDKEGERQPKDTCKDMSINCRIQDDSEKTPVELRNKFVICGVEGAGKSVLIREFLDRNKIALQYRHTVSCHVANMLEPYETIRQLLKAVFLKSIRRGSNCRSSFASDSGVEECLFDDDAKFAIVYTDLCEWAADNMAGMTIDLSVAETQTHHDNFSTFPRMPKRSDNQQSSEQSSVPISMRTVSVRRFLGNETDNQRSSLVPLVDLLPLLRVVLDTRESPPVELVLSVAEDRMASTLQLLIVELFSSYISKSGIGTMVIEDVQWADRMSFDILRQLFLRHNQGIFFLCSFRNATSFGRKLSYLRAESFEGGVVLNSLDEMAEYSYVLSLGLLSKVEVKQVLESVLGPDLIASVPNVLSEGTVHNIFTKSGNGVASSVMKLAKELEASVSLKTFDSHAGQTVGTLPTADAIALNKFDELSLDCQIALKTAAVCGTNFARNLLKSTLARLGHHNTICTRIDAVLSEIEDAGLVRRVSGADYAPDGSVVPASLRKRNSVSEAPNKTFTFTEKKFSDSIYSVMLEQQRQQVHAIVANLMEETITQSCETMSCNSVELLAFHYSRAANIEKEARYTELAASATYNGNMLSVAFNYYHHLVTMASHGRTVEQVMQDALKRTNTTSLFSVAVRNFCVVPDAPFGRKYITFTGFTQAVHSSCPYVSDHTLSVAIAEMSSVKYKQCLLMESHNLMVLSLHVRGICLSPTRTSFRVGRHKHTPDEDNKDQVGKHLFLQANSSFIRGHIAEAEILLRLAMPLLENAGSDLFRSGCALFSSVLLLQNKKKASGKWQNRAQSDANVERQDIKSTYYSHVCLHTAVRSMLSSCDFHSALTSLSTAVTPFLLAEDCSPLKYSIWCLSTWLYFIMGRPNKANELLHTLRQRDKDNVLMRVWCMEFMTLSYIMQGQFNKARKALACLKTAQKGRMGSIYHSALVGILSTCKKNHLSLDADTRDDCINAVILATTKLATMSAIQAVPIAIVCLFLSAYCAVSIFSQLHKVVGLRQGGGVKYRLMQSIDNAKKSLTRVSHTIPFVSILAEALQMKTNVVQHKHCGAKPSKELLSGGRGAVAASVQKKLEKFRDFEFGLAFWHTERCQHCIYFNTDSAGYTSEAAENRLRSRELFQRYGVPPTHFLLGDLSETDMSM